MDPSQLQPGYKLDRYELLCPLAYGGMAAVWLARFADRGIERMVVLKMILPQHARDRRFQQMFLDEARIASRIDHPNVARILHVGEHHAGPFLVMDWIDGDPLSKVIRALEQKNERVPLAIATRIVADAAAGLHAAHELKAPDGELLGVVHRDVSPQNVLVGNNGTTVIIDFGVAKARDRFAEDTRAGQLKGKVRYMAPEQALGQAEIDRRADVWALGAILYELLAGRPPIVGKSEVAMLQKLASGKPPPRLPAAVPEALRTITMRALAPDPDARFATARELQIALESARAEHGGATTAAVVAGYAGALLGDRKGARKRAVDAALDAARQRAAGEDVDLALPPLSTGAFPAFGTPLVPESVRDADPPSTGTIASATSSLASGPPATRPRMTALLLGIAITASLGAALVVAGALRITRHASKSNPLPPATVTASIAARPREPETVPAPPDVPRAATNDAGAPATTAPARPKMKPR
jgi:eukaryotic-like serine/threonine-protein kinase